MGEIKKQWPVQDAKARFSELLNACLTSGPQTISRRGKPEAVMVALEQWQRISGQPTGLKQLLLEDTRRFSLDLPQRGQGLHRSFEDE